MILRRGMQARPEGFSLLEVLITIVIVSVGLLGLAALQAVSLRANESANSRTKATSLAYMIIDRMRAHGGGALATATAYYGSGSYGIAVTDLQDWQNAIQNELGTDAVGSLAFAPGQITVTVTWTDAHWAITGSPTCNSLVTDPTKCAFQLVTVL